MRDLLDGIHERVAAHEARRGAGDAREAPDASIFQFVELNELLVSRLIAWLLDPRGTHAQGARFLEAFCAQFHVTAPPGVRLRVELEVATHLIARDRRRIDICVLDRGWALGIENKPVAGFQDKQLADYLDQLSRYADGNAWLVLLKGWEGDLPRKQLTGGVPAAIDEGRLVNSDYNQLQLWLQTCRSCCDAPYVASLLADLEHTLQRWLTGGSRMDRQQAVVDGILDDARTREAAFELVAATDQLYAALSARFVADVRAALDPARFRVLHAETDRVDLPRKDFLDIELDPRADFKFSVGFDRANLRLPYYGLRPRGGLSARARPFSALRKQLGERGIRSRESYLEWWFWWVYADEPHFPAMHDATVEVWKSLADGSFAGAVAERVDLFHEHLAELGRVRRGRTRRAP